MDSEPQQHNPAKQNECSIATSKFDKGGICIGVLRELDAVFTKVVFDVGDYIAATFDTILKCHLQSKCGECAICGMYRCGLRLSKT
jgi:hypothetical protein